MPPSQVLLLTQGRTGCHVLERMLSKQPKTRYLSHPTAWTIPQQNVAFSDQAIQDDIPEDIRKPYLDSVKQAVGGWEKELREAQASNETLFVHEHPQFAISLDRALHFLKHEEWKTTLPYSGPSARYKNSNYTLIPSNLLLYPGTSVILTIRHPAYTIPKAYQALTTNNVCPRGGVLVTSSFLWQREIFDFFTTNGITPIVVESEDFMISPEFVKKICSEAGMDPKAAIFSWPKATEEELATMSPRYKQLVWSLLNSSGLDPKFAERAGGEKEWNLEEEVKKWKKEYGDEVGELLKQEAYASLVHYEYLRTKKLRS